MNSVTAAPADKAVIAGSFSRAACLYDCYADHHRIIARRLMDFAPSGPAPVSILEIGCETGIPTEKLLRCFPDSFLTALDISSGMVDRCRRKLRRSSKLSFIVSDAENYCSEVSGFDLVAASCSLQWIRDRSGLTENIHELLSEGGMYLLAIPVRGMLHELEESCRQGARRAMRQLDLDTEDEWIDRLSNYGLEIFRNSVESITCEYGNPLEVLRAIRGIGAVVEQGSARLNPADMRRMSNYYLKHFRIGGHGRVSSTYRILYVQGRKS